LTRRLCLAFVAVLVTACANDYDQFSFGPGQPQDASKVEAPVPDAGVPQDRAESAAPDVAVDGGSWADADAGVAADVPGIDDARDAVPDAPDDRQDAEPFDAGLDVVDAATPDAEEEPDVGIVEDASPDAEDAQDAPPDVSIVDEGGDADASTVEDASAEADSPEDVSVDSGSTVDGPTDAGVSCDGDQKTCGDRCVGLDDLATGCGGPSCNPCNLPHATARCGTQGECIIDTCDPGFDDCDHAPDNGCERSLFTDVDHCGACGRACSDLHVASKECMAGVCVSTCELGFGNCQRPSTGPDDGCELAVTADSANCGSCGNSCEAQTPGLVCGAFVPNLCGCTDNNACRVGGSTGTCDATGVCKCGPSRCQPGETCRPAQGPDVCSCNDGAACAAGEVCCDLPNGCRNISTDPTSCGACGHACPAGFVCNGGACACGTDVDCGSSGTCAAGQCVCNGTMCPPGKRCLAGGSCG
jgi:hypothetical protein